MSNGRNRKGQFAKGNAGGPGRPRRASEADYLAALGETVTVDDWREIVRKAADDAKAGDAKARAWLATYLVGRGDGINGKIGERPEDELPPEDALLPLDHLLLEHMLRIGTCVDAQST